MSKLKNNLADIFKNFSLLLILYVSPIKAAEIQSRITHGQAVQPGQFPWLVIIKEPGYSNIHCGGSLIAAAWVLTAGHCLHRKPALRLFFGSNTLRDPAAPTLYSQQFYTHHDFNDTTYDNDVGLIHLPLQLTFNAHIRPIPLVSHSMAMENPNFVGLPALIVGLGLVSDEIPNSYPTNAFYANVIIISREECQKKFPFTLPLNSICSEGASTENEKICDGDSGGGLVARNPAGGFMLIGVNSFGSQKCSRKPSGYANVALFLNWIQNVTNLQLASFEENSEGSRSYFGMQTFFKISK